MMTGRRYEMGRSGGLVPVDVAANSLKNNLPPGTVLHWGGNMGWPAQDYAIVRRSGDPRGETFGVYYDLVSLEKHTPVRVEAFSIKSETDPKVWHSQHFFLTDRRLTDDEILDLVEAARQTKEAKEAKANQDAEASRENQARLRKEHTELLALSAENSDRVGTAAKNIRKELKRAFPGIKFSVRLERYSGGNSIDVSWTDGPTGAAVKKITDKYQGCDFDGMTDSEHSRSNDWIAVFGKSKYVFEHREISKHFVHEAAGLALSQFALKFAGGADPVTPEGIDLLAQFTEPWGRAWWRLQEVAWGLLSGCDLRNGIAGLAENSETCVGREVR